MSTNPGEAVVNWLYGEQLQIDPMWSIRCPDAFTWWADQHAQTVAVVGSATAPDGALGHLVQIRTEVAREVHLTDDLVEALQAGFMCLASMSGPVHDPDEQALSLCSLIMVHEDIRHWVGALMSVAAMLQISEASTLGRKLEERFGVKAATSAHPTNGIRPVPDELVTGVPGRLLAAGREPSKWLSEDFSSGLTLFRNNIAHSGWQVPLQHATVDGASLTLKYLFDDAASDVLLCGDLPHRKYGNGLRHVHAFPVREMSEADGARAALSLNRKYLVDEVVGYGFGSFVYFEKAMFFTNFFPNVTYGISLVPNLCAASTWRAEEVGRYLLERWPPAG